MTTLDPRNEPAYSIAEASRYLRLSPATVRSWFLGRPYPTVKGLSQFALINLSAPGQLAMRKVFEAHLTRVEWGKLRSAVRLYPFVVSESVDAKPIVIDPLISLGRPVVGKAFVSTRSILDRIDAGESVDDVARDYDITNAAVEATVVFERAA